MRALLHVPADLPSRRVPGLPACTAPAPRDQPDRASIGLPADVEPQVAAGALEAEACGSLAACTVHVLYMLGANILGDP